MHFKSTQKWIELLVFTALTPTCQFYTENWWCPKKCSLQNICYAKKCNFSWDQPHQSIISEFNLFCHDAYKAKIVSSYAFLGYTIGCIFWGWMGDKIGRVPTIHLCQFLNTVLLYLTSLSPSYEYYCLARIFTGFTACHWNTACVYATEWGGKRNRSFTLLAHIVYSSVAFALFGTIAFYVRPWRQLIVALSIFGGVVFLLMLPALKESPRWLFCHGKKEKAVENIQFAAKVNGLPVLYIADVDEDIILSESSAAESESVKLLFQRPRLIFITATFYLTSAANVLIYYMLKFSAEKLSSSPYVSCWLLALSDLPSAAVVYFCSDVKRRPVNFWVQLIAVAFCFLCCVPQVRLASAVLCMAFAAVSFNYVYLYLAEVYPTTMRNRVTAGCIAVAEIGGMVSNPLVLTTDIWDILPFLIAASVAVGPTIASWWLPETKNRPLPDHFIDTLNIVYTQEERPLVVVTDEEAASPKDKTSAPSFFRAGLSADLADSVSSRRDIPSLVDSESIELAE
ncbi:hypothetical protein ACHWQZ_G013905 [Mnemiopsis leidyi]